MTLAGWGQLVALVVLLGATAPLLGRYIAGVYEGAPSRLDRVFGPLEQLIYRSCRVDPKREQRWSVYAYSLLAFSAVSVLILYAQLRLQGHLPLNPDHLSGTSPALH